MCIRDSETGNDHEDRAADGKDRQNIVLPDGGALLLADPLDEHRDIERIDRDCLLYTSRCV